MEISDLKPLVEAGARLLDEKQPGWYDKFTPETWRVFDMWDEYHDILGTIFGSFHLGTAFLFPDSYNRYTMAEKYGFDCTKHYDGDARHDLESLWYEMIIDRQENGVPDAQSA